jgi:NUAK family SNF1-like kinase
LFSIENNSNFLVYESREKIILVMEYASGGELYDYLNRMKRIPESQARAIFRQIVSAVHFLHKVCQ